jgi:hypothetical protein
MMEEYINVLRTRVVVTILPICSNHLYLHQHAAGSTVRAFVRICRRARSGQRFSDNDKNLFKLRASRILSPKKKRKPFRTCGNLSARAETFPLHAENRKPFRSMRKVSGKRKPFRIAERFPLRKFLLRNTTAIHPLND